MTAAASHRAQARRGRDAALKRLLMTQLGNGSWRSDFDFYSFPASLGIIMLRVTGLIEKSFVPEEEVALVRGMLRWVNRDGGFAKFPGSPSSRCVTQAALTALCLVLGEVGAGRRPTAWFCRNQRLDPGLEKRIRRVLMAGQGFLDRRPRRAWRWEFDHLIVTRLVLAYCGAERRYRSPLFWLLRPMTSLACFPKQAVFGLNFNRLLRAVLPSCYVLHLAAIGQRKKLTSARCRRMRRCAELIIAAQSRNGGWLFNAVFPMLNMMALRAVGIGWSSPVLVRAVRHLRRRIFRVAPGTSALNVMDTDIWDTGHALFSYLSSPDCRSENKPAMAAIRYLLAAQHEDGGYSWGKGFDRDVENDSTAFALRALALARANAGAAMKKTIAPAVARSQSFLLARQNPDGGWSVWDKTRFGTRRGSFGVLGQLLLDRSSADQTARILEGLAASGLTADHAGLPRALEFLIKIQCRDGSWWSRWWAGYIAGTDIVLMALAASGLGRNTVTHPNDWRQGKIHQAGERGAAYLLGRQNRDGGWGETIRADSHRPWAGRGESTPLHTAYTLSALLRWGLTADDPVIVSGLEWLLKRQTKPGQWEDRQSTFTFYARSFYYPYPFHNLVLPLNALNDWLNALG